MFQLVRARRRNIIRREASVACQAVRLEGFRSIGGRLLDLSHQGALLECNGAISVGDEIVVSFRIPRGGEDIVDAIAEVRRVIRHEHGARAGIAFTEMDWDDKAKLFVALLGCPPPVPRVRPVMDYAATVRHIARRTIQPAPIVVD